MIWYSERTIFPARAICLRFASFCIIVARITEVVATLCTDKQTYRAAVHAFEVYKVVTVLLADFFA